MKTKTLCCSLLSIYFEKYMLISINLSVSTTSTAMKRLTSHALNRRSVISFYLYGKLIVPRIKVKVHTTSNCTRPLTSLLYYVVGYWCNSKRHLPKNQIQKEKGKKNSFLLTYAIKHIFFHLVIGWGPNTLPLMFFVVAKRQSNTIRIWSVR